ncbi:MAG TPA: ABC transporter ATP-binding protein, partial [Xanthobacteraceae bacterium]|nr:ABC transporter ATP-binding protein [Xanthobacteraceae bacterium]
MTAGGAATRDSAEDEADRTAATAAARAPTTACAGTGQFQSEPTRAGIAVELTRVSYTYEGELEPVLNQISLRVQDGEFVLILGPSGCGKSTLMQLLNGTIPHMLKGKLEGSAVVCGKNVAETAVTAFATDVGMVFQDPEAQIINTRVRDEVCFALENLCRPPDEILARQADALAVVGLGDFGGRSIFDLSGGEKQRVSIAAVLAAQPRLLVLDEPTANLDPAGMAEVFAVLERLNRAHATTIILVEHRVDELADKVSRVVMMDRGRIVFDGPPRTAFAARRTLHAEGGVQIPTGTWFPEVSEFALALSDAMREPGRFAHIPLNVAEATALGEWAIDGETAPAASIAAPDAGAFSVTARAPLLAVENLSFGYERARPVLNGVTFALESRTIVALMGRNGSGKTTLARALIGINPPPKGAVLLNGMDIAGLGPKEISTHIGYVFQNPDHQFVTDRVDLEVAYGLQVRGYAEDTIERIVTEVLEIVDLAAWRHRSPFSLSLGERRRLSVATMLVLEPRLLILDEPTIGQDHERAQQLMGLMARLRERFATTILMITHDVRLVANWADRVVVLSEGRLAFDGSANAL